MELVMLIPEVIEKNKRLANVIQPFNQVLAKTINLGVPLSEDVLRFKAQAWPNRIKRLRNELTQITGTRINVNSSDQLQALLYGYRPKAKKAKKKKTDKEDVSVLKLQEIDKHSLGLPPVYNDEDKITADQSALAQLHYDCGRCQTCKGTGKQNQAVELFSSVVQEFGACKQCKGTGKTEYDRTIAIIREIRLISHRANNFLWPFWDYTPCPKCSAKGAKVNIGDCDACEGSGVGEVTKLNDRLVTWKNGWPWFHPVYLQTPNTLRLACVDRNIQQFARYQALFKLRVRDIIVAPPGYKLVLTDYSKGERWGAACIYKAESILNELKNKEAFAELASVIFGLPKDLCKKGSSWYDAAKVFCYAGQYLAQPRTVWGILLKMTGINMPLPEISDAMEKYWELYDDYFQTIKEFAWKSYERGWCKTLHGAKYAVARPPILAQFTHWTQIYRHSVKSIREEARAAFHRIVRAVTSFMVQSSITGVPSQLVPLKYDDALSHLTGSYRSLHRCKNGNPDLARIFLLKHDEIGTLCREDLVSQIVELQESVMRDFNNFEPFLKNHPSVKIPLGVETKVSRVWDEIPPKDYKERTCEKNPLNYWTEDELHFVE